MGSSWLCLHASQVGELTTPGTAPKLTSPCSQTRRCWSESLFPTLPLSCLPQHFLGSCTRFQTVGTDVQASTWSPSGVGADLAIISSPGWIQFTNYLCCPGSLRFKYQVNPIICSLPSLPESSVFHGKEAQGLSIGPRKTWDFLTLGEGKISPDSSPGPSKPPLWMR